MPIVMHESKPAPTGTPFIRRMIDRGEFAPAALDMTDHECLVQWVNANAAERVALVFTDGTRTVGTVGIVPPKANNHGGLVGFREDRRGQRFPHDLTLSEGHHWCREHYAATPAGVDHLEMIDA